MTFYLQVTVKVIEESAFPPIVQPLHVNIAVYDDEFPGGMIGKVAAEDPDQYDHLTYTVVSNEMLFDVHQWDGTLKVDLILRLPLSYWYSYVLLISGTCGKLLKDTQVSALSN